MAKPGPIPTLKRQVLPAAAPRPAGPRRTLRPTPPRAKAEDAPAPRNWKLPAALAAGVLVLAGVGIAAWKSGGSEPEKKAETHLQGPTPAQARLAEYLALERESGAVDIGAPAFIEKCEQFAKTHDGTTEAARALALAEPHRRSAAAERIKALASDVRAALREAKYDVARAKIDELATGYDPKGEAARLRRDFEKELEELV